MIRKTINEMSILVSTMKALIESDIEDIRAARHEKLLERNDQKQDIMNQISDFKQSLNNLLVEKMQEGVDINIYREDVDNLELELKSLYQLNAKLASIVLPIKQMYKDIVDELTEQNGGNLVEIKA